MLTSRRWYKTLLFLLSFAVLGGFLNPSVSHASSSFTESSYSFQAFDNTLFPIINEGSSVSGSGPTTTGDVTATDPYPPQSGTTTSARADTAYASNKAKSSAIATVFAYYAIADATSKWEDIWTVTGGTGSGQMTVTITLTGSITGLGNLTYTLTSDNQVSGYQGVSVHQDFFTSPQSYTAIFPFTYGTPFTVDSILDANAGAIGGTNNSGTVDFFNTALVTQILLPEGATLTTDSKATYPTSNVPLPSAVWLLGSGLASLAGCRRFRKG